MLNATYSNVLTTFSFGDKDLFSRLRYSFQDDENLFLVLDLKLGGDLRFHLNQARKFSEEMVLLIAAEIGCALAYLHNQRVIHRDVKPDNILLDEKGHVCLTDFNVAGQFSVDKPLTAMSGTLSYMGI